MHEDSLTVTESMVRALLREQFPELAGQPVRRFASSGTVNAVFRVGTTHAARFPLRPSTGVEHGLRSEAAALRELGVAVRFEVPRCVFIGEPGDGYPQHWAVHTWLDGKDASVTDPAGSPDFARDLAELISGIRSIDVGGKVFSGNRRGGRLVDHADWVHTCLEKSVKLLDVVVLEEMWQHFVALDEPDAHTMNHGDLTPGNVLVRNGRLVGVLDCGMLGPADPALDLIVAWNTLDAGPRTTLRAELGVGDLEWERSKAWAFQQAMGLVWYYETSNPYMSALGRRTLQQLMEP